MNPRFAKAFTLIEILLVALILAVMASLVVPTLASASAPLNEQVSALLDADLRRGRLNSMGAMQRTVLVVGRDRDRWWLQPAGAISEDRAIDASLRVLGIGNLAPFNDYRLEVSLAGTGAPAGDVVVATFDLEGNRDTGEIGFQLVGPESDKPLAEWMVRPERTRVVSR
jgi:prepilin-type N-terminal cleavage/methylation domain-containing protein